MKNELMPLSNIPSLDEMKALEIIVKHAVDSRYLDKIGGFSGAFAIAIYAREMGIPLMSALFGGVRPVLGKVEIAPQMMNALIRRAGHSIKTIEHSDLVCKMIGKRKDTGEEMPSNFSIEDDKRAQIYKGAWLTYPKNMVYKSAMSNLAKWLFPDVIGMSYVEGELDEDFLKEKPQGSIGLVSSEPEATQVEIIDSKPPEMTLDDFVAKMNAIVPSFTGHPRLMEYIEFKSSQSKNPPKFSRVCEQALNIGDRFVKGFEDWLKAQAELETYADQALAQS